MTDLERARLAALEEKYRGLQGDMPPFGDVTFLLRMVAATRREGAEEMRERAAAATTFCCFECSRVIRALPLTPEEPT